MAVFLLVVAVATALVATAILAYARGYRQGVADCRKKLPEIASIATAEVTKHWSVH